MNGHFTLLHGHLPPSTRARALPTALHLPSHPSLLRPPLFSRSRPASPPCMRLPSSCGVPSSAVFAPPPPSPLTPSATSTSSFSPHSFLPSMPLLPSSTSFPFASATWLRVTGCHFVIVTLLPPHTPLLHPPPPLLSPSISPTLSPLPPPLFSPNLVQLVAVRVLSPIFFNTFPPPLVSPLRWRSSRLLRRYPSSTSFSPHKRSSRLLRYYLSSSCFSPQRRINSLLRRCPSSYFSPQHFATIPPRISPLSGASADDFATILPLVSPLSGAAADYFAVIPPPLISPLTGAAADYSAVIPPLMSPLSGAATYYFVVIPPLISPLNGSTTDYLAPIPPLISPLNGSAPDYLAPIPPLLSPHICSITIPSPISLASTAQGPPVLLPPGELAGQQRTGPTGPLPPWGARWPAPHRTHRSSSPLGSSLASTAQDPPVLLPTGDLAGQHRIGPTGPPPPWGARWPAPHRTHRPSSPLGSSLASTAQDPPVLLPPGELAGQHRTGPTGPPPPSGARWPAPHRTHRSSSPLGSSLASTARERMGLCQLFAAVFLRRWSLMATQSYGSCLAPIYCDKR
ncbi:unnamed protein product [Closterium sp. NIES-65]|nr:unnamed protein product [Closterium sp. NIES-65]